MEVQELKKLIKANTIPNFLIFTGDEWLIQKEYIKKIAEVKKLEICYIDSIDDIWSTLTTKSLFSTKALYAVRDDKTILTNEKVYSQLTDILKENVLILQLTSVDKRLKMIKQYNDSIVEFNTLKSDILKQYIQREIALNDRNTEILMEICDYNYGYCLLEIDKIQKSMDYAIANEDNPQADLVNYALKGSGMEVTGISVNKVFERLLEDGTIYVPPRDTMWDFIKAFLKHRPLQAYELYQDLKELETPIFAILTNLYNETKHVLQVQICQSGDIARITGLSAWQIKNAKECINRFKSNDLAYLLRLIQKVESGIKQGKIDEDIAIDYIFTNFY